ncbi:IclR family transcriptional regulator domain-containing protein [Paraburkholderia sp. J94]|uniref:IclR family transcriptional regulator domain-containing protein n=1 Tax=Paraburkholderia sp. J94 TaxID=2805441 RepID=UPI002AB0CFED|nr:IclR family transcriptional regulator C-terminal domain-containing protein [Paraburkholderia sp. J94]
MNSRISVRCACQPGALRPLHANAIGKAIFGELVLGTKLDFERYTEVTATDLPTLVERAAAAKARGWYANIGESAPELRAVAAALDFGGDFYGLSIGGPTERIRQQLDTHVDTLRDAKARILAHWRENEAG